MTPRLLALSLAPLIAAAGVAHAQAPGQVAPAHAPPPGPYAAPPPAYGQPPAYAQPPAYGPYAAPPPPAAPLRRWAIGVSIGGSAVEPEGAPEGSETRFRIGELALRYRASRRVELALELAGGREVLEDETEGDLATGSVTLALRYRFLPERRWNWFLVGGFGGTVIAPRVSTEAEREGATRPLGFVGVGIERRFHRFALQAELRAVGIGPREDADDFVIADGPPEPAPLPPGVLPRLPAGAATVYADELGGGSLTIGASYYF